MSQHFQRLWTPWRMAYILSDKEGERDRDCIFCAKLASDRDAENYVVWRGAHGAIMLNLYPYNNGHLMIIPYAHVPSLEDLPIEVQTEMIATTSKSLSLLRKAMQPDGFNIGVNIGRAAGAGIESHVHIHVVPRWEGDTNFMPILAETRVIPQWLDETYAHLTAILQSENSEA
ncbi:MAG: HIT domain-containing protein [Anaerolineae bacterium]|nr:MAG: HIT domain-containing protein [Anaerolineae bacterium]